MADTLSRTARSENMRRIRAKDTEPEIAVRRALHRMGLRFRLHASGLPGKPDVVLRRHNAVVLIHGCFWHRHSNCRLAYTPKTRRAFWMQKFAKNQIRDRRVVRQLRGMGYGVFVVWECQLKYPDRLIGQLTRLS